MNHRYAANVVIISTRRAPVCRLFATWPTAEAATSTLLGTPFGPLVSALSADAQHQLRARLAGKLGDSAGGVTVRTVSDVDRGTK